MIEIISKFGLLSMKPFQLLLCILFLTLFSVIQSGAQTCGWLIDPELEHLYEGHYEFHEKRILHIKKVDGIFWGKITGASELKLTPSGLHEFYFTDIDAKVEFNIGTNGVVTSLDFTRGEKQQAKRIGTDNKPLKKKHLKRYTGDYKLSEQSVISVFIENGILYAQYNDQKLNLIPLRKHLFYSPKSVMKIGFNPDFDDKILSLTLYVGQAMEFKKVM